MSEALYTSLRDETAAALITRFGRGAILRRPPAGQTYDPATGKTSRGTPRDTNVKVLEVGLAAMLKGREGKNQFQQEQTKLWDSGLIMSAKETAAASIEPEVGHYIVVGGKHCRIEWLEPVAPSGIPIIYKIAISRK